MEKLNSFEDLKGVRDQLKNIEEKELNSFKNEALGKIKPFIEESINNDTLNFGGSHGHLNYVDEKFWGHYISPTKDGVLVTVYLRSGIKGDPMDIDGERGPHFLIEVPLDEKLREKMLEKIKKEIEEQKVRYEKETNSSIASSIHQYLDEADESIKILEDGLRKK